jgi:hypothetical protein
MPYPLINKFKFTFKHGVALCGLLLLEIASLLLLCIILPPMITSTLLLLMGMVEFIALSTRPWFQALLLHSLVYGMDWVSQVASDAEGFPRTLNRSPVGSRRLILFDWRHWAYLRGKTDRLQPYTFMGEMKHGPWLIPIFIPPLLICIYLTWMELTFTVDHIQKPYPGLDPFLGVFDGAFLLVVILTTALLACVILALVTGLRKMRSLSRHGQILTAEIVDWQEISRWGYKQVVLQYQFWTPQGDHIVSMLQLAQRPPGIMNRRPESGNRLKILYVDPTCMKIL